MGYSARTSQIKSSIITFFKANKKLVVCVSILFLLGVIVGVASALRAVGGEFEEVFAKDAETGGVRVFFISALWLIGGYALILISGVSDKTVFLLIFPFFILGYLLGRYACALIGRYSTLGLINLLFAYLPFCLVTFVCFLLSASAVLRSGCADRCSSTLKASFVDTLKLAGINIVIGFFLFVLIGSIYGVIIVEVY